MYKLTPKAKQDIKKIYKVSRRDFGETQADKYYRAIFEAFRKVDTAPNLGADYSSIRPAIRGYRVQSHIVFFKRAGPDVEIVRILHRRMDYKRYL